MQFARGGTGWYVEGMGHGGVSVGIREITIARALIALLLGCACMLAAACAAPMEASVAPTGGERAASGSSGEEPRRLVEQARRGIESAIRQAETSLGPHQPGSGHTKLHMQRVVNQLEGAEGLAFRPLPDDAPQPDGAVLPALRRLRSVLSERGASPDLLQAVDQTLHVVDAAASHARRATAGTSIQEVHEQAGLAAALVVAARGAEQADSPVTGALSYVERHVDAERTSSAAGQ